MTALAVRHATAGIVLPVYLGLVGAVLGSFGTALAWRIRTGRSLLDRSRCESCLHVLGARDLVPIAGWALLRGRCRYCGVPIGVAAPAIEATMAGAFVMSYLLWPLGFAEPRAIGSFLLWLGYLVVLAALVQHDLRWLRLPNRLVLPLVMVGAVDAALRVSLREPLTAGGYLRYTLTGAAVVGGMYALLFAVSGGRWAGLGDAKLGAFVGVVLGGTGGLTALAVANVSALAVMVVLLRTGRLARTDRVPLGPFLAAGFVVAGLWAGT